MSVKAFINVFLFSLCTLCWSCSAQHQNVKSYSKEEFLSQLDERHNFVMFFAPWCSHCERLSPVWEDLAKEINTLNVDVTVAKVDCTIHSELCINQDITGYPTLKLFKIGASEGIKFKGSRDVPSLKRFLSEELGSGYEVFKKDKEIENEILVELNDETFKNHVADGNHFVKFFAPWCSHCQTLAPVWHKLAETLKGSKDVTVSKIDCSKSSKTCSMFDVMSYPTLLWIKDGKKEDVYQGDRAVEDLVQYVSQMLQPVVLRKTEETVDDLLDLAGNTVVALTNDNFQSHIESGITFVKFFAPWCGHCKRLAPTWEELAQKLPDFEIAHVDCTLEENKDLCNDEEVEGYPTLFLYRNGAKISEYNGSRVLEDLIEFVKRHKSHDEL